MLARHSVECVGGYKHTAAGRLGQSCLMPSTAVYTSPAMVRDGAVVSMATALDLAGPVTATLTVSTDGPSAHVFLKVCDVGPDGISRMIVRGQDLIEGGAPRSVTVDLTHTGYRLNPGHSLRLHISTPRGAGLSTPRRAVLVGATLSAMALTAGTSSPARAADSGDAEILWPQVRRPKDLGRIPYWDAAELSVAIRHRIVSCVEVMTAYLDHIDRINPKVNALVSLRPRTDLLKEARTKDHLLDQGACQGWMHGFPHAVKDLADVEGMPTTYGLIPLSTVTPATADSLFVERIRAAGAIFIGKTNTPELGLGSHTYNNVFGTTYNAYDQSKAAGGSSGGAAVAVALRMLPVADGSDFMGSLRNPPGWNNVLGLRPSYGRVPSFGGDVFIDQGGVEGPIARTALDLALLLRTMSGHDDRAPMSLTEDTAPLTDLTGRQHGKRVAWLGDLGGYLPMERDVLDVTRTALQHFSRLGMTVTTLDALPTSADFDGNADLWPTWLTYRHWLSGMAVRTAYDSALRGLLKPEALYEYEGLTVGADGNGPLTAVDVYANSVKRSGMYRAFRDLFDTYDYVVLPTAQVMPFDATAHWPRHIEGVEMSSYHRWMEVATIGTLIGAPTLAVPAGFNEAGLPIGLQVIAGNRDDFSLLDLAQAWERQTGFVHGTLPGLLSTT
ncbi:amidase [Streptomyces tauricus]|uniref:amidase n=1 Tax=Streptomyces tauricus TaxID=68274 RepID=UPI00387F256E